MLKWSFTFRVGVLEPYPDLNAQLQGAEDFRHYRMRWAAGEEVIQRRPECCDRTPVLYGLRTTNVG
ncbi:MAG: hypothetical protein CL566_00445 [Alphaproteobacteria bacterium]|nr:hypothetical protein [Alphaproteobacteria bacterium]